MKLQSVISSFDLFAVEPTMRVKQRPYTGSFYLGIFTCLIYILIIALIATYNYQIVFEQFEEKQSTGYLIKGLMFSIGFDSLMINGGVGEYQKYFTMYVEYWSQAESKMKYEQLQPCVEDQWKKLGDDYVQQFYKYQLNETYCPLKPLNITLAEIDKNYFKLVFSSCNSTKVSCKNSSQIQEEVFKVHLNNNHTYFTIYLSFLAKKVQINQKQPISYFVKQQQVNYFLNPLSTSNSLIEIKKLVQVELERFKIEQRESRFSFIKTNSSVEGFTFEKSRFIRLPIKNSSEIIHYMELALFFNQNVNSFTRKFATIDGVLSYVGGVFLFIFGFFYLFLRSYNEIKYELTVADGCFSFNQDGSKMKSTDLNFWTYVKWLLYRLIKNVFFYPPDWLKTKSIFETQEEASYIMNVNNLVRRLEILESVVEEQVGQNMMKSMSIIQPLCIQQIRTQRNSMNYLNTIVNNEQTPTVEDCIKQRHEIFQYLGESDEEQINIEEQIQFKKQNQISFIRDLYLDEKTSKKIAEYGIIAKKAEQIELNEEETNIEKKLTEALLAVDLMANQEILMRIPVLVLNRMRMRAASMNQLPYDAIQQNSLKIKMEQSNKQKIKKNIEKVFTSIDVFSSEPFLRIQNKPKKSNICFGFLDFLIFSIFTAILITEITQISQLNNSELQYFSYQNTQRGSNISIENLTIAVKFDLDGLSESFGGPLSVLSRSKLTLRYKGKSDIFVPCTPNMWKKLTNDNYKQFAKNKLDQAYCIQKSCNLTNQKEGNSGYVLDFSLCTGNETDNTSCLKQMDYYKKVMEKYHNFRITIYYLAPEAEMDKPAPLNYIITNMTVNIPNLTIGYFKQDISRERIKYDDSLWPFQTNVSDNTYFSIDSLNLAFILPIKNFITQPNNTKFPGIKILTSLGSDITTYQRRVNKIDTKFSYYGGILGFLIFFFRFFLLKFNLYRYEIRVADSSFNLDSDGKKVTEKQLNGFTYISFSVYQWIKSFFCYRPQWEEQKRMDKTIKEVVKILDAEKLFRRMEFLQRTVWQLEDKNLLMVMSLIENPRFSQVHRKKMILEYYDLIVQQKPAASVEDSIKNNLKSFDYLKSYKTDKVVEDNGNGKANGDKNLDKKKKQIRISLMNDLGLSQNYSRSISEYPKISEQAEEIQLTPEWSEIEEQITYAFLSISKEQNERIMLKIPLIIIHRLRMKAKELKKLVKIILKKDKDESLQIEDTYGLLKNQSGFELIKQQWNQRQKII